MENVNINKNHSRMSLSGIFNACRGRAVRKQQSVEDPRLQPSGMVPLFDDSKRAFTLIELLVVVLIIGILAAIALPQYEKAVEKARATEALIALSALSKAQNLYYLENSEYATDWDALSIEKPASSNYFTYSKSNFDDGHLDLRARDSQGNGFTSVNWNGKQSRIYCSANTTRFLDICKGMGVSSTCSLDSNSGPSGNCDIPDFINY